jgi:hypothetical protein
MDLRALLALVLVITATAAFAGKSGGKSDDQRWNVTGPAWYDTPCGHQGFSVTHGLPYAAWRKPCSVPIRVCEYERTSFSYPADPDIPCEQQIRPEPEGGLKRTYIKRWD